jgi:uncharacterized repeat protein (TIGR03803 family)
MKIYTKYYMLWVVVCLVLSLTITVRAQFRVLHNFTGNSADGSRPQNASLIQSGSMLYGMTMFGGGSGNGVIFQIHTDDTDFQLLHSFVSASNDGQWPQSSLIQSDSTFFGMTYGDGINYNGNIFKIKTDGTGFSVLHWFTNSDGSEPMGSLIQSGSILYGMNSYGGSGNAGTIFQINTDGSGFHVLHTFIDGNNDGLAPHGSLIQSGPVLYGTTLTGGSNNLGTIFKINTDGTGFQLLHSFVNAGDDGSMPAGTLIQSGSDLYGMSSGYASNYGGTLFKIGTDGSGFQVLHSFKGTKDDGMDPNGFLILSGSTFYGMTHGGGSNNLGTVFQINIDGTGFKLLHSFGSSTNDGTQPWGSLTLSDSILYGMTCRGGSSNNGIIFALDLRRTTSVDEKRKTDLIDGFQLSQNYPNPFNPSTVISYQLPAFSNVKLSIYNMLGQKIKTLVNGFQNAGEHSLVWDATDEKNNPVSSGMYFYSLVTNEMSLQKKMVLVR